jgi:hypothetical protein
MIATSPPANQSRSKEFRRPIRGCSGGLAAAGDDRGPLTDVRGSVGNLRGSEDSERYRAVSGSRE